jgi:hypothetical protein
MVRRAERPRHRRVPSARSDACFAAGGRTRADVGYRSSQIPLPSARISAGLVRVSEYTHLSVSSRHHPSDRPVRRLAQPMARAGGRWEDANRSGWPSGEARSRGPRPRSSPRSTATARRRRSRPRPHPPRRRRHKDRHAARWEFRPAAHRGSCRRRSRSACRGSAAMTGASPKASAFCVPETAKSASPAPSNTSTGLRSRSMPENQ